MARELTYVEKNIDDYYRYINERSVGYSALMVFRDEGFSPKEATDKLRAVQKAGLKVAVAGFPEKSRGFKLRLMRSVNFIEKDSGDMLKSLAEARYIYFEELPDMCYVKRPEQYLCLDAPKEMHGTFRAKMEYSSVSSALADSFDFSTFCAHIRGEDSPEVKESKPSILIFLKEEGYTICRDALLTFLTSDMASKFSIDVIAPSSFYSNHRSELLAANNRLSFLVRRSKWNLDEKAEDDLYEFKCQLGTQDLDLSHVSVSKTEGVVSYYYKEIWKMFGSKRYDMIIDIGKGIQYWDTIALMLQPSRYFILSDKSKLREERLNNLKRLFSPEKTNIEIVYSNAAELNELSRGYFDNSLLSYCPSVHGLGSGLEEGQLLGKRSLICDVVQSEFPGVLSITAVPYFEDKKYSYIVVDNLLSKRKWMKILDNLLTEDPNVHIYDFFNVLRNSKYDVFSTNKLALPELTSRYIRCYWYEGSSEGIAYEANAKGVPVMTIDSDGAVKGQLSPETISGFGPECIEDYFRVRPDKDNDE